ncbi:MAG: hypothetical protein WCE53_06470 [Candidatus Acidiferrum sp.]
MKITKDQLKEFRAEFERAIVDTILNCPSRTYKDIGVEFQISDARVAQIAVRHGIHRKSGPKPIADSE